MSAASRESRAPSEALEFPLSPAASAALARAALEEDKAFDDVTTLAVVPASARASAAMVARSGGVVAGLPLAAAVFEILDSATRCHALVSDGTHVRAGDAVLEIEGTARAVLSAERVALNFAQRLSGIATLTARYVDAVRGTRAKILDTRKTTPLFRVLEKYAVRCGGGTNHRADLAAAVLIKDNHLATLGGDIALAVRRAREHAELGMIVEVECDTRDQVARALEAGADAILLDNMPPHEMTLCVELVRGAAIVEASGGITLESVRAVAEAGVDWISVGALTHSVPALDLALDFRPAGAAFPA
jgi:nicotinate-nucleotide pyrophosphorylase (carboxylating)